MTFILSFPLTRHTSSTTCRTNPMLLPYFVVDVLGYFFRSVRYVVLNIMHFLHLQPHRLPTHRSCSNKGSIHQKGAIVPTHQFLHQMRVPDMDSHNNCRAINKSAHDTQSYGWRPDRLYRHLTCVQHLWLCYSSKHGQ